MNKIVFFDLETSGLSPWKNEIIQVAAVVVKSDDFSEIARFGPFRVSFDVEKASPEALKINHYEATAWEDAISQKQLVDDFGDFLRDHSTVKMTSRAGNPYYVAQLAGHNILRFDMPFLQATFKREGGQFLPARFIGLDTLQLAAWKYFDDPNAPKNLKLEDLVEFLGAKFEGKAHDAMADVIANIEMAKLLRGMDNPKNNPMLASKKEEDDLPF